MQIQVNTDHTIEGHEALAARIRGVVGECPEPNERSHHAGGSPPDRRTWP
jgi:hypothetical protein